MTPNQLIIAIFYCSIMWSSCVSSRARMTMTSWGTSDPRAEASPWNVFTWFEFFVAGSRALSRTLLVSLQPSIPWFEIWLWLVPVNTNPPTPRVSILFKVTPSLPRSSLSRSGACSLWNSKYGDNEEAFTMLPTQDSMLKRSSRSSSLSVPWFSAW